MSLYKDLRLQLLTLKYSGILCVSYKYETNTLHESPADSMLAKLVIWMSKVVFFIMIVYCLLNMESFNHNAFNKTGNIYHICIFYLTCLMTPLVQLYCYVNRREFVHVVQQLLIFHQDATEQHSHKTYFRRLYIMFVVLIVISAYKYCVVYSYGSLPPWSSVCFIVALSAHFIVCGNVVVFYICIRKVLVCILRRYNRRLDILVNSSSMDDETLHWRLQHILMARNHLLALCQAKVNHTYGIILLPLSAFVLFTSQGGIFYLITVILASSVVHDNGLQLAHTVLLSFLWDMPWLTVFIVMMGSNNVDKEANNTAKVLSRTKFKGSSLRKMVDKFLLKNWRQKPVLTAYGFFNLDRSTLFQLFSAIFTYMVILVQLRDMEGSTKRTNN